jgi:hypothetical protein
MRRLSPPPGFDSRTVQPVESRYTAELSRPFTNSEKGLKFATFESYESGVNEESGLLGNAVLSAGKYLLSFRKNLPPSSSVCTHAVKMAKNIY